MKKVLLLFLILLSLSVCATDRAFGNITLLALSDSGQGEHGTLASLQLEVADGDERVFLRTFPMTKITTQASLRFAQQVACRELGFDCSGFDFLFSIDAMPGIVGGPSAGSSAAILVSSLLLNKSIPKDVAMTGTINSGGIIGPVGGVAMKLEAAASNGIRTVFVPPGHKDVLNTSNGTLNISLVEYGTLLNISVREVATLRELIEILFNVSSDYSDAKLVVNDWYVSVMESVTSDLCTRSEQLKGAVEKVGVGENFINLSVNASRDNLPYAAASFCFRANVELSQQLLREQSLSQDAVDLKIVELKNNISRIMSDFDSRKIRTMTELQTYMAVMERLIEAQDIIELVAKNETSFDRLGYAQERVFSAVTWGRFFDGRDKNVVINDKLLAKACLSKIEEAEERYNYVKSIVPEALEDTRKDIDRAYSLANDVKYISCLYTAAKAKAEADMLMGLMGVEESSLNATINVKLDAVRFALVNSQLNGIFPIIAYSYYEYAKSLLESDRISALLFSEYALELANIELYFDVPAERNVSPFLRSSDNSGVVLIIFGVLVGIFAGFILFERLYKENKEK